MAKQSFEIENNKLKLEIYRCKNKYDPYTLKDSLDNYLIDVNKFVKKYKIKQNHTHWNKKSLMSLFLSIPFVIIYFWKEEYNVKFPYILATVIMYALLSSYYTYYEKCVENNCFLLFEIQNVKKFQNRTIGLKSEIKMFDKYYNLTLFDYNNKQKKLEISIDKLFYDDGHIIPDQLTSELKKMMNDI